MLRCQGGEAVTEAADFRELFKNCFGDFGFKEISLAREGFRWLQPDLTEQKLRLSLVILCLDKEEIGTYQCWRPH